VAVTYDDLKQFLIDENIPFCTLEFFDIREFDPHVVFFQNPYEETRPEFLRIDQLMALGSRIAYIPYGLELGGGAWNLMAQFDLPVHRLAWRVFSRSERHKKMFGKYCRAGNQHVIVTGHPKFDSLNGNSSDSVPVKLTNKIAGRKVILWTPHFSVGDPPTWSTYRLYGEFIINELRRRQKLFLLIRPHPLLFNAMQQHQAWDAEGERDFRQSINDSNNMALDESSDYHVAFSISDALMADVGSFLLEYLPTGKPLLYLHHTDGLGMNDDGDLIHHLYMASSPEGIVDFIDMVTRGEDPLKGSRESALPDFLFGLDSSAGDRICQHVYSAISAGDSWSPDFSDRGGTEQVSSETYWKNCNNTYLAPPEYESKEAILGEVLARQPMFINGIDIGCGDGRFTLVLAKYVNEITGYDISQSLVEKAREAAATGNIGNVRFVVQELETIAPFEKYDLVACMGVTSCIIDDIKFLRILDKFKMLVKPEGYLLLIDTLSSENEQIATDQNGYVAKYRSIKEYCYLIGRRGFIIKQEALIKEMLDRKLINKLFLFTNSIQGTNSGLD
jgi:SAM-dependent methyltransferase